MDVNTNEAPNISIIDSFCPNIKNEAIIDTGTSKVDIMDALLEIDIIKY